MDRIMKKLFYISLALCAALFTACKNDAIETEMKEVVPPPTVYNVTYKVSTQPMYDTFGITDILKNRFLSSDRTYYIGVYTFIYNQQGDLVASDSTYSRTFGVQNGWQGQLSPGTYTVVTLEMLVDSDEDYLSDTWRIDGKQKLSELEIRYAELYSDGTPDGIAYWYAVVGSTSEILTINADYSKTLVPSAMGAIIETNYFNFDKSSYNAVALPTKNIPVGRYLDPSRTGSEKMHYGPYLSDNIWDFRCFDYASSGLESSGRFDAYILECGRVNIHLAPTSWNSGEGWANWTAYPGNDFYLDIQDGSSYYAGIYYLGSSSPQCTAGFYATQEELASWLAAILADRTGTESEPDPTPVDLTFEAPYLTWGASVSTVKSYMAGLSNVTAGNSGNIVTQTNSSGEVTGYYLWYSSTSDVLEYDYFFETATTNLHDVYLYMSPSYTVDQIVGYFKNQSGYTYQGSLTDSDVHVFTYGTTRVWIDSFTSDGNTYPIVNYYNPSFYSSSAKKRGTDELAAKTRMSAAKQRFDVRLSTSRKIVKESSKLNKMLPKISSQR